MVHQSERYRQVIGDYWMIGAGTKKCGEKLKGRGGAERKKSMPLLLTTQVYKKKIKKA